MKENYSVHKVPETSLMFGLGIPFLAFANAVDCWDEDDLRVRDGFGFIDWQRYSYQKTFGEDFFPSVGGCTYPLPCQLFQTILNLTIVFLVDVVHYTGPLKPWAPNSSVEDDTLRPWLRMMELEGLDLPPQLPKEPTKSLFALLTSPRSGSEWIMTMLDEHPEVCASGESKKPEMGFPTEVLNPYGTAWLPGERVYTYLLNLNRYTLEYMPV